MLTTFLLILFVTVLSATPVLFQNGDFEEPNCASSFCSLVPDELVGWTIFQGSTLDHISTYINAYSGQHSVELGGESASGIYQDIPTVPGSTYDIIFQYSANSNCFIDVNFEIYTTVSSATQFTPPFQSNPSSVQWYEGRYSFTANDISTRVYFRGLTISQCNALLDYVQYEVTASDTTVLIAETTSEPLLSTDSVSETVLPTETASEPVLPTETASEPVLPTETASEPVLPTETASETILPTDSAETGSTSMPGDITTSDAGNTDCETDIYYEGGPFDCTEVFGNLYITVTDISELSGLTRVELNLVFNAPVENLDGLSGLIYIGGDLQIEETDITNLDGLSNLEYLGNLSLSYNPSLRNVNGLSKISSLGSIRLNGNFNLMNLNGLSALETIGGDISGKRTINIRKDGSVPKLTKRESLSSFGVEIVGNGLTSIILPSLKTINGILFIASNENLEEISLNALTSINGELQIGGNPQLKTLSLNSLTSIYGEFAMGSNPLLTNLEGLASLLTVTGSVYLEPVEYCTESLIEKFSSFVNISCIHIATNSNVNNAEVTNTEQYFDALDSDTLILQNASLFVVNSFNVLSFIDLEDSNIHINQETNWTLDSDIIIRLDALRSSISVRNCISFAGSLVLTSKPDVETEIISYRCYTGSFYSVIYSDSHIDCDISDYVQYGPTSLVVQPFTCNTITDDLDNTDDLESTEGEILEDLCLTNPDCQNGTIVSETLVITSSSFIQEIDVESLTLSDGASLHVYGNADIETALIFGENTTLYIGGNLTLSPRAAIQANTRTSRIQVEGCANLGGKLSVTSVPDREDNFINYGCINGEFDEIDFEECDITDQGRYEPTTFYLALFTISNQCEESEPDQNTATAIVLGSFFSLALIL